MAARQDSVRDDRDLMPSTYLAVLLLVAEGLRYGYEIDKALDDRGFREWVDIRMSSVYKALGQLEKQGLVRGTKRDTSRRPSMKVYGLTRKGRKELQKQVLRCLSNPPKANTMFDLGMSAIWSVTREEALDALRSYGQRLDSGIHFLEDNVRYTIEFERLRTEDPSHSMGKTPLSEMDSTKNLPIIRALFERPLAVVRCQRNWLGSLIETIERNEDGLPFRDRES